MWKVNFGIRGRVLAIALVPSFALLAAGVGSSYYLVEQGFHTKDWTKDVGDSMTSGIPFSGAMQRERWLSLMQLAGDHQVGPDLVAARKDVDHWGTIAAASPTSLTPLDPTLFSRIVATATPLWSRMPPLRQQVDAGTAPVADVYSVWSGIIGMSLLSMDTIARTAPDATTSVAESKARSAFNAGEALSRAVALSAPAMVHGWMPAAQLPQLATALGSYRADVDDLTGQLTGAPADALKAIVTSPAWQRLNTMEDTILRRGTTPPDESSYDSYDSTTPDWVPDLAQWQRDAAQLDGQMLDLYRSQQDQTLADARANGDRVARNSMYAGAGVLGVSIAVFGIALWLSGLLIQRLRRLRGDTLSVADEQLPELMNRLRRGESVDVNAAVARLDYGDDEIGQVADAFNRAQLAAVTAAVTEAKTREGVKAVFLNIAHRSQVVVHKQLEILDRAEYETEDSAQLDVLFRLDHLATRERRNAENLIILGGDQPGRRWRTPVSLEELVRSAVGETEDYSRVRAMRLPELLIAGSVVADLVHLLAELVDNATSFSPPESRVDVTGTIVGRGVVVEITDQGLGMTEEELHSVNETLRNPPDFSVETLSTDSRLGLFVVAQLAIRNEISVRLVESAYGGVRAIVLIPTSLIAADAPPAEPVAEPSVPEPTYYEDVSGRAAGRHRIRLVDEPPTLAPNPAPVAAEPPRLPVDDNGDGDRPTLPRRTKQTHLASQLTVTEPEEPRHEPESMRPRSPEQARNLLSAIESGTRQGRNAATDRTDG